MLPLLQKALGYFSLSIPGCPIRGHVGAVPSPRRAAHHVMMRLLRLAASPPAGSAPTKSCCSSWLACICMPGSGSLSLLLVRVVIEAASIIATRHLILSYMACRRLLHALDAGSTMSRRGVLVQRLAGRPRPRPCTQRRACVLSPVPSSSLLVARSP